MTPRSAPDPKWEGVYASAWPDEWGQRIRIEVTWRGQLLNRTIIVDPQHGLFGFRYALDRMVIEMDETLQAPK